MKLNLLVFAKFEIQNQLRQIKIWNFKNFISLGEYVELTMTWGKVIDSVWKSKITVWILCTIFVLATYFKIIFFSLGNYFCQHFSSDLSKPLGLLANQFKDWGEPLKNHSNLLHQWPLKTRVNLLLILFGTLVWNSFVFI